MAEWEQEDPLNAIIFRATDVERFREENLVGFGDPDPHGCEVADECVMDPHCPFYINCSTLDDTGVDL